MNPLHQASLVLQQPLTHQTPRLSLRHRIRQTLQTLLTYPTHLPTQADLTAARLREARIKVALTRAGAGRTVLMERMEAREVMERASLTEKTPVRTKVLPTVPARETRAESLDTAARESIEGNVLIDLDQPD